MSTLMPRDGNSAPVPVLAQDSVANALVTASSAATAIPGNPKAVRISTQEDVYILFGDSGAVSTTIVGTLLLGGSTTDWAVKDGDTHIAAIRASVTGVTSFTSLV